MKCTRCTEKRLPSRGSHVPHYCDACGFPLMANGEALMRSDAASLYWGYRILQLANHVDTFNDPFSELRVEAT